jgi:putative DNA primase/helicase
MMATVEDDNQGLDMEDYWGGNVVPLHGGALDAITVEAGRLHTNADDAERALIAAGAPLYVRAEKLVRPIVDDLPASHGRRTKAARLTPVTEAAMIDYLSRAARFQKWDGRSKRYATINPPTKIAQIILSRDGEWPFRRLSGVITTPTIRPDGTILREPGYDEATQLLLLDPPEMPKLPAKPSRKVAEHALKRLDSLLDEFPFTDEASRSVALSALITPVVRGALSVAPMHVTKAPVAGSGKSYIIDLASALNSGERAPVITAGRTEEETEKRLVAALLTGQTIISIDNVNGELGGDALCQIIERPVVSVRPLGQSAFIKIESRATCYATGNNIRLVGDMTRRVVMCSLDPDMERPELREFKRDPFDDVLANRGLYVAAALTIVSAYMQAGCPDQARPVASFEDWSRIVRSALIWLGRADPVETMNAAREDDPVKLTLLNLLTAWHTATGSDERTAGEIVSLAQQTGFGSDYLHENLREVVTEIAFDRAKGINSTKLGFYLRSYADRVVGGFKLINAGKDRTNKVLWKVVKV